MRLTISSLLLLTTLGFVTVDGMPANPPTHGFKPDPITPSDSARPIVGRMTNAERLSMGLPPLKPRTLQRGSYSTSPSGSNHQIAVDTQATLMLPRIPHKCNILVKNAVDGSTRGYLTTATSSVIWPCYNGFQESQAGSLEVSFYTSPDDPSPHELDFFTENAPYPSEPYFSARVAASTRGTSIWACIKGSASRTPPGSVPQSDFEYQSAIWKYNLITQDITAQWVHSDGSSPPTQLSYSDTFEGVGLVASVNPSSDDWYRSHPITFTCVPPLPIDPVR